MVVVCLCVCVLVKGLRGSVVLCVCVSVKGLSGTMCCCPRSVHCHSERLTLIQVTAGEHRTSDLSPINTRLTWL